MSGSDQAAENPWPRVKSRASSGHRGSSQIFGTITLCLVNAAAPHEALSGPIRQGVMAGTYRMVCFFTLSCLIFRSSVDRGIPSLAVDRENIESVEEFLDAASRLRVSRVLVGRQSQPGHIGRLRGGTIARGRSSWWRRIASSVEKGASIATSDSPATSPSCPSFHSGNHRGPQIEDRRPDTAHIRPAEHFGGARKLAACCLAGTLTLTP
jgi:hypothetical protein